MNLSQNVAVIGLGSMGFGIAASALRGGHRAWGYDVNPAQAEKFRAEGGADGALAAIAGDLDVATVVVLNAAQTEDVLFGADALVPQLRPGAVVVSCATIPPQIARDLEARCANYGVLYLDAPISGGAAKAASGELTIMASGTDAAFAASRPVLDAIAATVFELGDKAGPGSAMKATNQLLAGVHIAAMAEALTFGMTQGIAPQTFLEVISKSAGTSWTLENRAPLIIDGDYSPRSSVNIWPKDLGIVLDVADLAEFEAPITATALAQYRQAVDMGLGGADDAAVARVYARQAGLTLPKEDEA